MCSSLACLSFVGLRTYVAAQNKIRLNYILTDGQLSYNWGKCVCMCAYVHENMHACVTGLAKSLICEEGEVSPNCGLQKSLGIKAQSYFLHHCYCMMDSMACHII